MNKDIIWTHPPDRTKFDQDLYVIGCGYDIINDDSTPRRRSENHRIEFHILYFIEGGCTTNIEGKNYIAKAGDVVFFHSKRPYFYTYHQATETKVYWLHFSGNKSEELVDDLGLRESFIKKSDVDLSIYFQNIIDEITIKKINYNKAMAGHLMVLLTAMVRKKTANESYLDEVISRMTKIRKKDLDLDEYASICYLSKSQFIRKFKDYTGKTPIKYKNDIIIEKAKERLSRTDISISQIASLLGFENVFYFSSAFKKATGLSPLDFRKKHR